MATQKHNDDQHNENIAKDQFELGVEAIHEGRFQDAVDALSLAISNRPSVSAGYRQRALAYRAVKNFPAAIKDLNDAIRLSSKDAQLYAERAELNLHQQCYQQAIDDCSLAIQYDSARGDVYGMRATAYGRIGQSPQAFEDYETALKMEPERADEYFFGRALLSFELEKYEDAIRDLNQAIILNDSRIDFFELRAKCQHAMKLYEEAEKDYLEIITRKPGHKSALLGLCVSLIDQQKWSDCQLISNQLISNFPDQYQGYEIRGITFDQLWEHSQAIEDFSKAIALKPKSSSAYHLRGNTYLKRAQWTSALSDHLQFFKLAPDNVDAINQLAWLWACCPDDEIRDGKKAIEFATRACEKTNFEHPGCLDTLAAAFAECDNFASAIKYAERAIRYSEQAAESSLISQEAVEFEKRLNLYQKSEKYRLQVEC